MARYGEGSPERHHLQIEALKLAWVLRNRHIADADAMTIEPQALLGDKLAQELAAHIDMKQATTAPEDLVPMPGSDTVYLTVVGQGRHRHLLHQLDLFRLRLGHRDAEDRYCVAKSRRKFRDRGRAIPIASGRASGRSTRSSRQWSVRTERSTMSFGVMGGSYQPMGHMAVVLNRYVYGRTRRPRSISRGFSRARAGSMSRRG